MSIFATLLHRLARAYSRNQWSDYTTFIKLEKTTPYAQGIRGGDKGNFTYGGGSPVSKRVINFWAFSPGIAMEELKGLGARSIILTSGRARCID